MFRSKNSDELSIFGKIANSSWSYENRRVLNMDTPYLPELQAPVRVQWEKG